MVRVEQEYEAISLIKANRIEVVTHIELLVSSTAGEVAGEQFVDHFRQFAFHGLREPLRALFEGAAGFTKLTNRRGLPTRQAPPPEQIQT